MRNLKDILEHDLGSKWSLTESESDSLWESISSSLPASGASAPARKGRIYWYWAGAAVAAAAAVVAGIFLLKSPSSDQTPFRPEITPIEKTTTLAERAGESITDQTMQEKATQNPVLAYVTPSVANGRQGLSESPTTSDSKSSVQTSEANSSDAHTTSVTNVSDPKNFESEAKTSDTKNSAQTSETNSSDPGNSVQKAGTSSLSNGSTRKDLRNQRKEQKEYYKNPVFGKRFSIAASSNYSGRGKVDGPSSSFIKATANQFGYEIYSTAPEIQNVSQTTYSLPLNFAVGVNYKVSNLLTIGSGVSYSYLHSKYNGLINGRYFDIKQGVHYIGIPVNLYFNLGSINSLDFYAATGGSIEKGVNVTYQMSASGVQKKTSSSHVEGVQFSVKAAAGMEYRLGKSKNFGIYLEPGVTYYFDSKLPASIRTDQPLQFEAQAGVRFHLK